MTEVRFDRMVPSQIVARRDACSVAWLPVGSLEWHGPHMPFGTDTFTVAHLSEVAAQRLGGAAFPPVYYGDVRCHLQECRVEWRKSYAREMDVPAAYAAAFPLEDADGSPGDGCPTRPDDGPVPDDPLPFDLKGQQRAFARLLAHVLLQVHLYGFRSIVILPGHGPNPPVCRQAETVYAENVRRRTAFGPPARTLTWFYIEAAKACEPLLKNHWIHADRWEGSVTAAAQPDTVHPAMLPPEGQLVPAYLGQPYITEDEGYNPELRELWPSFDALDPRRGLEAEYGRRQIDCVLDILETELADWLPADDKA
jgi:creatinine amidohydrolase/Fe(II)-dependent formamide hydrolase-like protein